MQKTPLIAAAAVAVLAVGGYALWSTSGPAEAPGSTQIGGMNSAQAQTASASVDTSGIVEMSLGDPDAPVTIIEYSSFTCPHCANFNQGVYRELIENYVDTGQVHYIKREVYFDAYGLWAALVARCAGPERYHGVVEMLYQDQRQWAGSSDGAVVAENLRRIGRRAGMDNAQLDACLSDRDKASALMELYRENAERDGIRSTPSFVINGQTFGNMGYAEFEAAIADARD
ncbi:DsbA family protein [Pararhodobacter sp. SW119]|uniref:DsbA family protein n=1 Tax=Pararhodobacter sp. SW119 TaxID=2780075 RepID=UPI001ADF3416|nr:DsbA family protein [Pararhodobacter sp. SW119]